MHNSEIKRFIRIGLEYWNSIFFAQIPDSISSFVRPYPGVVASMLATVIYVGMVMPILYDNSYSPNDSNFKYAAL